MEERIYWPRLGTERAGIVGEGRKWCEFIGKDRGVIPLQCCVPKDQLEGLLLFLITTLYSSPHFFFTGGSTHLCFTCASMQA